MATYAELRSLFGDGECRRKIEVAVVIAAQVILSNGDTASPPWKVGGHALRAKWANGVLTNPEAEAVRLWMYVLAAHAALALAQIRAATDTQVQDKVNQAVDEIATALYG